MKKTVTPASQLGAKLANNKMVQVVARLFKKEDFSLTEEEQEYSMLSNSVHHLLGQGIYNPISDDMCSEGMPQLSA